MAKLPPERLAELLSLYGATRTCHPDEAHMRRLRYREAIAAAAQEVAIFDVNAQELDSVIRDYWHASHKMGPAKVPKDA